MSKVVTFGEIMLRLSSDVGIRLKESAAFHAHYGGGEANVAISLANFGHEAAFASKVPDHALGYAVAEHLRKYQVDTQHLVFGGDRLGTYYMEAGSGERAASVIYDRAYSSFAQASKKDWDLDKLFESVELFHVSGITPALSSDLRELTIDLVQEAKKRGIKVSFDINYRGKLWTQAEAGAVIRQILPYVDYCSAGKLDALYLLGIKEPSQPVDNELVYYYEKICELFPNIEVLYSTKREVVSASDNYLQGTIYRNGEYVESQKHHIVPIVDRVGGGDAFAGGILHGLLTGADLQDTVNFATAASALKHTIHGDCNQFNIQEVEAFLQAGSGKIVR